MYTESWIGAASSSIMWSCRYALDAGAKWTETVLPNAHVYFAMTRLEYARDAEA